MVAERIEQMFMMKKSMSSICDAIAIHLMSQKIFKTVTGKKMKEIFIYDDGIFTSKGRDYIEKESEKILGRYAKTNLINEIINKIERQTIIAREDLGNSNKNLICLKNGVLDIKTKVLSEHSPDYNFMSKIPVCYNPKMKCGEIFKFLNKILIHEDIEAIQEWFGYQLYREYFIKRAAIFRGVPDTGKTTFMNLLVAFVGIENVSNVSLQMLAEGKWHLTHLFNKHANVCDDLSEKDIVDSGTFKQITGRSQIHAEYKFGDQFGFVNYAKLSFACNKIPLVKTDIDDTAYWDRWMIFDFENIFAKDNVATNPHMIDIITTDNELSGLLNWALEGLERLQRQRQFSYRRDWEENRRIMQGEASSVARFVNECLLDEVGVWISNDDLYDKYQEFCGLNDINSVESQRKFGLDMRTFCKFGKFGSNRENSFGVRNVKVRDILPVMGL